MRFLAILILLATPAHALTISYDGGGVIDAYVLRYAALARTGDSVRIMGGCYSACTTVTGYFPKDRICIGPQALLGFHSAGYQGIGGYSLEGTRQMWAAFPAYIKRLVRAAGWDGLSEHPKIVAVRHASLRSIYKPCR